MRTVEEIKARITEVESDDWMGTQRGDLIHALPFEDARPWLVADATEERWDPELTDEFVRKAAVDYLPFAVGKALNHRGLSAGRSIDHYRAWLWLLGDEEFKRFEAVDYRPYGMPQLKVAAEILGTEFPGPSSPSANYSDTYSEEELTKIERMAGGESCGDFNCGC